jgi:serine/threonine protein kinase
MAYRVEQHAEPLPGYRLLERLGGGGFGEVWKCEAPGGIHKAIKFVFGDLSSAADKGQRAEQELKAMRRVQAVRHPYILTLERYDIIDGQLLIVMELADRSLWDRFKECRSQGLPGVPRDELLRYMEEAAEALDLMNQQYQLQHLDIKPQNLFLVHNHVKVADFGLVKDLEGTQASITGGLTPVYAAPETFDGKVTKYSDQYSLAIVYQEMLTGQRPFNGTNVRQLVMQHISAAPDLAPLPPEDREAVARALSKQPDQRFPRCRDLIDQLRSSMAAPVAPPGSNGPGPLLPDEDTLRARGLPRAEACSPSALANLPPTWQGLSPPPAAPIAAELAPLPTPPSSHQATPSFRVMDTPVVQAEHLTQAPLEATGPGALFPALLLGLGQFAGTVLHRARERLAACAAPLSQLPHLRWLLVDTDAEVVRLAGRGRAQTALTPNEILLAPLGRPSHYLKPRDGKAPFSAWLNQKVLYRIPRSQATTGVRALGRLAFCDNYRLIARRLQAELEAALDPPALEAASRLSRLGLRTNRPRVYVLAGLAGGTGSGMFLDAAYTVRALLRQMGYDNPDVVGVLFTPPVDRSRTRTAALGNAFAALTELSHWSRPGTVFQACYHERESPIHDARPPFSRTVVLPLPEEGDELGTQEALDLTAQWLARELATPLGKAADQARAALSGRSLEPPGQTYSTFGLFQLSWPRQALLAAAGRKLCLKTVARWLSKDSKPIRDQVQEWVKDRWERQGLGADKFLERLREDVSQAVGTAPDDLFAAIVSPLRPPPPEPQAMLRFRSAPAAPLLPPEQLAEALKALEALTGKPTDDAPPEEPPSLVAAMTEASEKLANEWSQKLAEMAVHLIEEPAFRLAGAEEAVRQAIATLEHSLQSHETLASELSQSARQAHDALWALARAQPGGRKPSTTAQEAYELLRAYPRWRFQSLALAHLSSAFVSLRGHLSDELREINFCRVRLSELHRMFEEVPPEEAGMSAQGTSSREASIERRFFLSGCSNLREAVDLCLSRIGPEELLDLDARIEAMLRKQFTALVNVCVSKHNMLRDVQAAMLQVAGEFATRHQAATTAAALFLEQAGDDDTAEGELASFHAEAEPELGSGRTRHGAAPPTELCLLAAPEDEAGQKVRKLLQRAVPEERVVAASSKDDVVIYRERCGLPLSTLPLMGPEGRDAYLQMTAGDASPHSRMDVPFRAE